MKINTTKVRCSDEFLRELMKLPDNAMITDAHFDYESECLIFNVAYATESGIECPEIVCSELGDIGKCISHLSKEVK